VKVRINSWTEVSTLMAPEQAPPPVTTSAALEPNVRYSGASKCKILR